jgi:hypothetical protein
MRFFLIVTLLHSQINSLKNTGNLKCMCIARALHRFKLLLNLKSVYSLAYSSTEIDPALRIAMFILKKLLIHTFRRIRNIIVLCLSL